MSNAWSLFFAMIKNEDFQGKSNASNAEEGEYASATLFLSVQKSAIINKITTFGPTLEKTTWNHLKYTYWVAARHCRQHATTQVRR